MPTATTGPNHRYVLPDLSGSDVLVQCTEGCSWRTIRPQYAARSALQAHRIGHAKGWYATDPVDELTKARALRDARAAVAARSSP